MSKEVAAAILTQTYFQSSTEANRRVANEVNADPAKGAAPAKGAVATVTAVYHEFLKMMPGNQ